MQNPGEILLYQTEGGQSRIDVRLVDETVWLSAGQTADLFQRDKSTISRHIQNVFEENELDRSAVIAFYATTAADGKTYQVEHFNLDVVISVGYRVKSHRGVQFTSGGTNASKSSHWSLATVVMPSASKTMSVTSPKWSAPMPGRNHRARHHRTLASGESGIVCGLGHPVNGILGGTRGGVAGIGGDLGHPANGIRGGTRTRASGVAFHSQSMVPSNSPQPFARFSAPVGGAMAPAHRPNGPAEPSEGLGPGGWDESDWSMDRYAGPCPGACATPDVVCTTSRTAPDAVPMIPRAITDTPRNDGGWDESDWPMDRYAGPCPGSCAIPDAECMMAHITPDSEHTIRRTTPDAIDAIPRATTHAPRKDCGWNEYDWPMNRQSGPLPATRMIPDAVFIIPHPKRTFP